LGWLRRQGRGWSSRRNSRDGGLLIGKGLFDPPSPCLSCGLQKTASGIMEPFWMVPEIKEKMYIGDLGPLFLSFIEKV
jgi:hypothetical protein